jgi:mRNA interferase RelE/StbE
VAEYTITFARSARKELQSLDSAIASRVLRRIETLVLTPRPVGILKLEGANDLWRIRVGDWRVVFRIDDRERLVDIVAVRHRREVYR